MRFLRGGRLGLERETRTISGARREESEQIGSKISTGGAQTRDLDSRVVF